MAYKNEKNNYLIAMIEQSPKRQNYSSMTKQQWLWMAELAQDAQRFEDMIEFVDKAIDTDPNISMREFQYLKTAYFNIMQPLTSKINKLNKNQSKSPFPQTLNSKKTQLKSQLQHHAQTLISKLENKMVYDKNHFEIYLKVTGLKLKAYEYLLKNNLIIEENKAEIMAKMSKEYREMMEEAEEKLYLTSCAKFQFSFQYSRFLFQYLGDQCEGLMIAKRIYDMMILNVDFIEEHEYKDISTIMSVMRDTMTIWESDEG